MEDEADDPANDIDLQLRDSVTEHLEKKVSGTRLTPLVGGLTHFPQGGRVDR